MAEALLNKLGYPRFSAHSAGSQPTGRINPLAMELLESLNYLTDSLRSKSWKEYAGKQSPHFDLVITVCDRAASEPCPIWPGDPLKTHWSLPDPASAEGTHADRLKAFFGVYGELEKRLQHLVTLPPGKVDREDLKRHLEGKSP